MRVLAAWVLPVLFTFALAAAASAYSMARLVERSRPDLALSVMPSLAPALTAKADAMILTAARGNAQPVLAEVRQLAVRSLIASPLNPEGLRLLAATGRLDASRPLLATALRTSRRDIGTQLMQIEVEVAADNVPAALRHYDQALRVSPAVGPTLFPVLLTATDTATLVPPIRALVANDPPWLPRLMAWSIDNPQYLGKLTRIVPAIPPRSEAMSLDYGPLIIQSLVEQNRYEAALLNYRAYTRAMALLPPEARRPLRPFDWAAVDNFETGSTTVAGSASAFTIFADREAEGDVLSRLGRLSPGTYRLVYQLTEVEGAGAQLQTQVSCAAAQSGRSLLGEARPIANSRVSLTFVVPPAGCAFQWVKLHARTTQESFQARLDRLSIDRVG